MRGITGKRPAAAGGGKSGTSAVDRTIGATGTRPAGTGIAHRTRIPVTAVIAIGGTGRRSAPIAVAAAGFYLGTGARAATTGNRPALSGTSSPGTGSLGLAGTHLLRIRTINRI